MDHVLKLDRLSTKYTVRRLNESDVEDILELCQQHTLYYNYCPPFVTRQSILDDMNALPPNKDLKDKFYLGYFDGQQLVAIMDLVMAFPDESTAYIGFFMINSAVQNKGVGTVIIDELSAHLCSLGMEQLKLGWVENNPQAAHFWLKNKFLVIETTLNQRKDKVVQAVRRL